MHRITDSECKSNLYITKGATKAINLIFVVVQ